MKHALNCKFCRSPITVEVADDYEHDKFKLLPLACCNHCSDVRVERRHLEETIRKVSMNYSFIGRPSVEVTNLTRDKLIVLTQKYAEMIAKWHRVQGKAWDMECVNLLMDKPKHWNKIIGQLWGMFKDWQKSAGRA